MIRYSFLFLMIVVFVQAQAQKVQISGRVIDKETSQPLSYAAIGIQDRNIGTITNKIGEFDFRIPRKYLSDSMYVQMLGYQTYLGKVKDVLSSKKSEFSLRPQALELAGLTIYSEEITAADILKKARANKKNNYVVSPLLMNTYYRYTLQVDGNYVSLIEAALDIYDKDLQHYQFGDGVMREQVTIKGVRQQFSYKDEFEEVLESINENSHLNNLIIMNRIRRDFRHLTLDYTVESKTFLNNKFVYVIEGHLKGQTKEDSFWKMKIWVEADNFAIIKLEDSMVDNENFDRQVNDTTFWDSKGYERSYEYKEYNGKYFPSFMYWKGYSAISNPKTGMKKDYVYSSQLLVNEFDPNVPKRPRQKNKEVKKNPVDAKLFNVKSDPDFWDDYNFIKETPEYKAILKELKNIRK